MEGAVEALQVSILAGVGEVPREVALGETPPPAVQEGPGVREPMAAPLQLTKVLEQGDNTDMFVLSGRSRDLNV